MKKEDQLKNSERIVRFSDADYQQDMRLDPLTTRTRIREELAQIAKSRADREAAEAAKAEAEETTIENKDDHSEDDVKE